MKYFLLFMWMCATTALAQGWQLASVVTQEVRGDTRAESVVRFEYHADGSFTTTSEDDGIVRYVTHYRADGQPLRRRQLRKEGEAWQLTSETVNKYDDAGQLIAWQSEDFHDGGDIPSQRSQMQREGRRETLSDETRNGEAWQTLSQTIREYDDDGQEIFLQTAMLDNDSHELRPQLRQEREYGANGLVAWRAYHYEAGGWKSVEEGKVHDASAVFAPWVYAYHLSEIRQLDNGETRQSERSYWLDYHATGILLAMNGVANESPASEEGHNLSLTFHLPNITHSWYATYQPESKRWHTTHFSSTVYDAARREIERRERHDHGLVHTRHEYDAHGNPRNTYIAYESLVNGKASHTFEKVSYEYTADITRDDIRTAGLLAAGFPDLARGTHAPVAIRRYRFDGRTFQPLRTVEYSYEAVK